MPARDGAAEASLKLHRERVSARISPLVHGHFIEHLGRCIDEGIWVGEDSTIPNTRGIRDDVVAALKRLGVPVLRWPGGCFADEYDWRDGIGPRNERPKRINTHWGGVIEDNQFGTHEFLDFCELVGAQAYVCSNVGSGSPRDMMQWFEYMTGDAPSTLVQLRRRNGREQPWNVPYFGIGNESWGCGGNMRAEYYADEFRRYATFVKAHGAHRSQRIACGAAGADYHWTEVLMQQAASRMDGLSLHYYTLPTGDWASKGSALDFGEEQWHSTFVETLRMRELLERHSLIMDRYDPERRVGLVVDEWGTWYDPEPGREPGFLYQQSTLRDALVAAVNLCIFHAHAERVSMANIAQTVNVLQALVLTDREQMLLTPTYYAFELCKGHAGSERVELEIDAPEYRSGGAAVPGLVGSASRDAAGAVHVTLVNVHPERALSVQAIGLNGAIDARVLTAQAVNSHNTFSDPRVVSPQPFADSRVQGDVTVLHLPAKCILAIELRK